MPIDKRIGPDVPVIGVAGATLFDTWDGLRMILNRHGVPPDTIERVRHGFYVGGLACFLLMVQAPEEESPETAVDRIERIHAELEAFKYDIGHAVRAER